MTKAEICLWSKLKGKQIHGLKYRRHYGIDNYTVDFYCPEQRLVIEIDRGVHSIVLGLHLACNEKKIEKLWELKW